MTAMEAKQFESQMISGNWSRFDGCQNRENDKALSWELCDCGPISGWHLHVSTVEVSGVSLK